MRRTDNRSGACYLADGIQNIIIGPSCGKFSLARRARSVSMTSATPLAIQDMARAVFGDRDAVNRMRVLHGHDVRPRFIRDRRGDDVAGRIFDRGRTRVVRKPKHLGRVGFQPLLEPMPSTP